MDGIDHSMIEVKFSMNKYRATIDLSVIKDIKMQRIEGWKQVEDDINDERDAKLACKVLSKKALNVKDKSAILKQ